jgi:hypothetical protein
VRGKAIILADDDARQASRFVAALAALPDTLPPWAVIGGFAFYARLARVHRATRDVDTVTAHQHELVELMVAQPNGERLRSGKVRLAGVEIDVMPVPSEGEVLAGSPSERAFHLVRRFALTTATQESLIVVDPALARTGQGLPMIRAEATVPIAGPGALVLLKAVALPRRSGVGRGEKVVSDTQDLLRLVTSRGLDSLMTDIHGAPEELVIYSGRVLTERFGDDSSYLLAILRRARVVGIEADDLALVAALGRLLVATGHD